MLANEAFQEPLLKDEQNYLYKTDPVFIRGGQALVANITGVRVHPTSFTDAAAQKMKYQILKDQELINASNI